MQAEPGDALNLTAVIAPNQRAAAEYYPAQYWFALLQLPAPSEFPGTGPQGNGISSNIGSQGEWIRSVVNTDGCTGCHVIGNKVTREIPEEFGDFESHLDAWERRLQAGQAGGTMVNRLTQAGRRASLAMYSDWTNRIEAGEYPTVAPSRPEGVERNVVISQWDWADPTAYMHDLISADKRDPTVNANGPLYGATEASKDYMPVLDPNTNMSSMVDVEGARPPDPEHGFDAADVAVEVLGRGRSSGIARSTRTVSPWTVSRACGSRRGCVPARPRLSVRPDRAIRRLRRFRSIEATDRLRCTTPGPRKSRRSTPALERTT